MRSTPMLLAVALLIVGVAVAEAGSPCCAAFNGTSCNQPSMGIGPRGCVETDDGNCVGGGVISDPALGGAPRFAGCVCASLGPGLSGCITDETTQQWLSGRRRDPSTGDPNPSNGDVLCTRAAVRGCKGLIQP
ncbi:MAG: hypothetical protein ACREQ9_03410 [Candidatus Binatia bacterium]